MLALILIAWKNVKRHWRHSLASLLSIMASVISLNVFQGYMYDLGDLYYTSYRNRSMYGDLVVINRHGETPEARAEPWKFSIDKAAQEDLAKFVAANSDLITASARFLIVQGLATNGSTSAVFSALAYDESEGSKLRGNVWRWNTLYGKPGYLLSESGRGTIRLAQNLGRTLGCVPDQATHTLANNGGYTPIDRPFHCQSPTIQLSTTTDAGQVNALDVQVSAIVDAGFLDIDRRFLSFDLRDAQTLLNTDRITYESILLKKPSYGAELSKRYNSTMGLKYPDLAIMPWQDHPRIGDLYNRTMNLLGVFRNFVITIIITISALSVFNSMTKAMSERTREIGTLLSLGFRAKHIRVLFLSEALMLGAIGVMLGFIASSILAIVANGAGIFYKAGMLSEPVPFRIVLSPQMALASSTGLILLTALTTAFALKRVLSKRIIECLQHV